MVQDCYLPEDILATLRCVVSSCKKIPDISRVILFGSYSKGSYNEDSDIDIAFFVKESAVSLFEVYKSVAKICCNFIVDIQPQVFYESEQAEPLGIVEEIIEYGLDITDI